MAQSQFPDVGATAPQIAPDELKRRLDAGDRVTVLDTRRPADVRAWRIEHPNVRSVNVPFYEFLDGDRPVDRLPEGVPDPGAVEGSLVVNCAKGVSSQFVGDLLTREGRDVAVLSDGMEGWARVYDRSSVRVAADGATVYQYHRPGTGCLAYLIVADGEAAATDPLREFADRYAADARAEDATLRYAMDTHVHADHLSGVRAVAENGRAGGDGEGERSRSDGEAGPDDATGADDRSTGETAVEVETVLPAGARDRGLAFDPDRLVAAGDRLAVGSATVEVVGLPGHTSEHVGYRVGDLLLCGDTLFPSGVGRPDLEAGADGAAEAAGRLYDTVRRLLEYPDETVLGSGHAATPVPESAPDEGGDGTDDSDPGGDGAGDDRAFVTTVGRAREGVLARTDREAFVDRLTRDLPPRPNNFRQIVAANLGRDAVADPFRVELGPNNCAVED